MYNVYINILNICLYFKNKKNYNLIFFIDFNGFFCFS